MPNNQQTQKKRTGLWYYEVLRLRAEILFEQDFACWDCRTKLGVKVGDAHLHHLNEDPKDNHRDNLVVLCKTCHWFIHGFQDSKERGLVPINKKKKKKDNFIPLTKFVVTNNDEEE